MTMNCKLIAMSVVIGLAAISCNNDNSSTLSNSTTDSTRSNDSAAAKTVAIKEEPVTYTANGTNCKGYVSYDSNQQGKRPAILVVHEWWGLTDYPRNRAKQLAGLGYIAMAVDMYGD